MDLVGIRLGMNCGRMLPFMPTTEPLWVLFAEVVLRASGSGRLIIRLVVGSNPTRPTVLPAMTLFSTSETVIFVHEVVLELLLRWPHGPVGGAWVPAGECSARAHPYALTKIVSD
jgi:hypothetical protein